VGVCEEGCEQHGVAPGNWARDADAWQSHALPVLALAGLVLAALCAQAVRAGQRRFAGQLAVGWVPIAASFEALVMHASRNSGEDLALWLVAAGAVLMLAVLVSPSATTAISARDQ
jgi:hypothetical protein